MSEERKSRMREKLNKSRERLLAVVSGLTEEQWERPCYADDATWRVEDLLRHLADSERGMTSLIGQIRQGGEGVPADFDLARWNRRQVGKLQDKPVQELLADMGEAHERLLALVDSLHDNEWDKEGRHASLNILTIEEILTTIALHERNHTRDIAHAAGVSLPPRAG
jgi:uncharacterized protein (TIGR03083 family)